MNLSSNPPLAFVLRHSGAIAAAACVVAVVVFAPAIEGYSHLWHPLALLGAKGAAHGLLFNLLAFVVPGALVAVSALRLRNALTAQAPWLARIGTQMVLLSALAFLAQGLLPLDGDIDSVASGRHAAAWLLWWLAFATGGGLLALAMHRVQSWQMFAAGSMLAAAMVPMFALFVSQVLMPGLAQRIAIAIWFAWAIVADRRTDRLSRNAV
ncbi:DUF998 domain-containing protein [Lysobacter terrae]